MQLVEAVAAAVALRGAVFVVLQVANQLARLPFVEACQTPSTTSPQALKHPDVARDETAILTVPR